MPKIEIYTSRACPYCIRSKSLLAKKGFKYEELKVDENPSLLEDAIRRSNGRRTVPQIFINEEHVGGYDDLAALDRAGKLDAMLGIKDSK
ncbi:MAG: glutaredoxin 3 [Deltaproteobacteria bacterium]|nr:glutaredoxin 3 [Deltaproteobacteria bacterium]